RAGPARPRVSGDGPGPRVPVPGRPGHGLRAPVEAFLPARPTRACHHAGAMPIRRAALLVLLLIPAVTLAARPAAAGSDERITRYEVSISIQPRRNPPDRRTDRVRLRLHAAPRDLPRHPGPLPVRRALRPRLPDLG